MKPGDGPIVLILAPTRELAQQVIKIQHLNKFPKYSKISNKRFILKQKNSEKYII